MREVNWAPNKEDNKPVYLQIVDFIAGKIRNGEWTPGSFIPTQRELAQVFQVNRSTIVAALDELKAIGLLEAKGKAGTQISKGQLPIFAKLQTDWQSYIEEGIHISNLETIQEINRIDFLPGYTRLSTGEAAPELFPTERMTEILSQVSKGMKSMGYEEPKGMPYLREQICRYVKTFGINTSPNRVLIVSGALQAIQLISLGLLQTGSTILLEKPSYLYSLKIFQSVGMRRCGIPMDSDGILADQIPLQKPKHRQSMLYTIPNYQNPTGAVMSAERRKQLLSICAGEKIPVIEDDVYRELWIDKKPPTPLKAMDDSNLVLYVGSVSKTLSSGLRIGWIVGPEPVVDRLGDIKMQTDYGSSSLAQLTVGKWMETGYYEAHNEKLREEMKKRREAALEALELYFKDIAVWNRPEGGYYIWLQLNCPVRMHRLFEEACKQGIVFYPGYLYDASMNQQLRISYSYAPIKEICEGLRKLSLLVRYLS